MSADVTSAVLPSVDAVLLRLQDPYPLPIDYAKEATAKGPHTVTTYTGKHFSVFHPKMADVCLADFVVPLARKPRWNGGTVGPAEGAYSVLQHSILVSCLCKPEDALWGLIHDFGEALLFDVPRPMRAHPAFKGLVALEDAILTLAVLPLFARIVPCGIGGIGFRRVAKSLDEALGITGVMPSSVAEADDVLLATERRDLQWGYVPPTATAVQRGEAVLPLPVVVSPWPTSLVHTRFYERLRTVVHHHMYPTAENAQAMDRQGASWGFDRERANVHAFQIGRRSAAWLRDRLASPAPDVTGRPYPSPPSLEERERNLRAGVPSTTLPIGALLAPPVAIAAARAPLPPPAASLSPAPTSSDIPDRGGVESWLIYACRLAKWLHAHRQGDAATFNAHDLMRQGCARAHAYNVLSDLCSREVIERVARARYRYAAPKGRIV